MRYEKNGGQYKEFIFMISEGGMLKISWKFTWSQWKEIENDELIRTDLRAFNRESHRQTKFMASFVEYLWIV